VTVSLSPSQPGRPAVPDFIEPVEAWRVWRVIMRDRSIVLQSLFAGTVWEPGVPLSATCAKRHRSRWRPWRVDPPNHEVPDIDCSCGIYGARSVAAARWYLESRVFFSRGDRVVGRVALWGDVVESESGWRASRAYPIELLVPAPTTLQGGFRRRAYIDEIVLGLEAYRVPVDVFALDEAGVA
jgi:hypothetical protein